MDRCLAGTLSERGDVSTVFAGNTIRAEGFGKVVGKRRVPNVKNNEYRLHSDSGYITLFQPDLAFPK